MFNAGPGEVDFGVPVSHGPLWRIIVDTARARAVSLEELDELAEGEKVAAGERVTLAGRSLVVLRRPA